MLVEGMLPAALAKLVTVTVNALLKTVNALLISLFAAYLQQDLQQDF